jgi:cytochrome c oxidase subunit 4
VSATVEELDNDSPAHPGEHHSHGPTDGFYFKIFWILVAITALEVSTYFWDSWFGRDDTHLVAYPMLVVLMVVKFGLIASFFMHLRFDRRILTRIFYFGLGLALVVYMIALSVMNIWVDNGNTRFNDPPPNVTTTTVPATGAPGATAGG